MMTFLCVMLEVRVDIMNKVKPGTVFWINGRTDLNEKAGLGAFSNSFLDSDIFCWKNLFISVFWVYIIYFINQNFWACIRSLRGAP
jgi:hypothetical protein